MERGHADEVAIPPAGVRYRFIHPALAAAFAALDLSGRPWLLLRGEDDLALPDGDVDLLVSPILLPQLDALLAAEDFHRVVAPGRGSHRFYFRYDLPSGRWLKLDVVSDIAFGPLQQWRTPLAEYCLGRRMRNDTLSLPNREDQAWLHLLHLLLDKGDIAPERRDMARAVAADATLQGEVVEFIDQRAGRDAARRLLGAARSGPLTELQAEASRVRETWTRAAPLATRAVEITNRARLLISPTVAGRSRHGVKVAVMGPDGAGKTTLLQGVAAEFPIPSKYVYMGLWSSGSHDALIRRVPGGRLGQKVIRIVKGGITSSYHAARGRLVLLDRVAYDARLPGAVDHSVGGRITSALAHRLSPTPDALFVLDAPGEVMFARKGEHSVELLEKWRKAYLQLADQLPGTCLLDATMPREELRARAVDVAWRQLVGEPVASARSTSPTV